MKVLELVSWKVLCLSSGLYFFWKGVFIEASGESAQQTVHLGGYITISTRMGILHERPSDLTPLWLPPVQ